MSEMQTLGVVGAGPMGAGIAQIGLVAGLNVVMFDLDGKALEHARDAIFDRIGRMAEKGQLSADDAARARGRLVLASDLDGFGQADTVIEAIVERLEPKQKLFADLEHIVPAKTVLATNTSSLSVAAIAAHCVDRSRVCGLHFFNPVPLMRLVEVVVAPATSPEVVERAATLSRMLGKVPVTVKDGPGFLVNLQGRAYATEGLAIVQEGVTDPATLDRIMREGAGFRMGPFELMDLTGIDVNFAATSFIYQGYQHDPRLKTTTLHEQLFHAGYYGRKTGRGFFDYPGTATKTPVIGTPEPEPFRARLIGDVAGFAALRDCALTDADGLNLIAPVGEDCSTACHRLGLDPTATVAIDFTALDSRHLTVMNALGGEPASRQVAQWLQGHGFTVETIKDSPGFVLQRILAMIANLGCELAQIGVGTPGDIDLAMKLAQNYPKGPLEWAEHLGIGNCHRIMSELQAITGSDRYRPSLWLRRRALLGLPIHEAD